MVAQREDDGEGAEEEGMASLWSDKPDHSPCSLLAAGGCYLLGGGRGCPGAAVGPLGGLDFAL